jgi:predicted dehydrogenase
MPVRAPAPDFTPFERRVRVAIVGLGRIYDLNVRAYVDNEDAEVVALVDPSDERRAQRQLDWPDARTFASIEELAASGLAVDAVEVLLPIAAHEAGVVQCLRSGWHVNVQKPMANDLASARRMIDAAHESGRQLRVMENYLFYHPLRKLKEVVDAGELGPISGYHMKMVASGRGGWEVPGDTYIRQFEQADRGRGILLFDDGWHKLSTALWLFGPVREVRAWRSTRPRRWCGSTRTASVACGTSPSPWTCTFARTTTPTTSAGR